MLIATWALGAMLLSVPAAADEAETSAAPAAVDAVGVAGLETRAERLAERLLLSYRNSGLSSAPRRLALPELEDGAVPGVETKTVALGQLVARELASTTYFVQVEGYEATKDDLALRVAYFNLEHESLWIARLVRPDSRTVVAVASEVLSSTPTARPQKWLQRLTARRASPPPAHRRVRLSGSDHWFRSKAAFGVEAAFGKGPWMFAVDSVGSAGTSNETTALVLADRPVMRNYDYHARRFGISVQRSWDTSRFAITGFEFPQELEIGAGLAWFHVDRLAKYYSPFAPVLPADERRTFDSLAPLMSVALSRHLWNRVRCFVREEYVFSRPIEGRFPTGGAATSVGLSLEFF